MTAILSPSSPINDFAGGPRLLADVGGTNARFALETVPGRIVAIDALPCADYPTLAAALLSYLTLYIGFFMAGFTERKRALHDMVASTLVVDKWAYTAHPEWQNRQLGTVTVVILAVFGLLFVGAILLIAVVMGLAISGAN